MQNAGLQFSGWAAAPLKALYLEECPSKVREQLIAVGKQENIDVVSFTPRALVVNEPVDEDDGDQWPQDNKHFIYKDNVEQLINLRLNDPFQRTEYTKRLREFLQLTGEETTIPIEGGDLFLGKLKNGDFYALTTNPAFYNAQSKYKQAGLDLTDEECKVKLAQSLGVKPEHFHHLLSASKEHIDMSFRPLDSNRILVNNNEQSLALIAQAIEQSSDDAEKFLLAQLLQETQRASAGSDYASAELTRLGFEPISTAGNFGFYSSSDGPCVPNFMNSIVHQRPDKSLVFITNDSGLPSLNHCFEKKLKETILEMRAVYFISGEEHQPYGNIMVRDLHKRSGGGGGGLHCRQAERPDFKQWMA